MRTGRGCRCEVQRFKQSVHDLYGRKMAILFYSIHISQGLDALFYMCICLYINSG